MTAPITWTTNDLPAARIDHIIGPGTVARFRAMPINEAIAHAKTRIAGAWQANDRESYAAYTSLWRLLERSPDSKSADDRELAQLMRASAALDRVKNAGHYETLRQAQARDPLPRGVDRLPPKPKKAKKKVSAASPSDARARRVLGRLLGKKR